MFSRGTGVHDDHFNHNSGRWLVGDGSRWIGTEYLLTDGNHRLYAKCRSWHRDVSECNLPRSFHPLLVFAACLPHVDLWSFAIAQAIRWSFFGILISGGSGFVLDKAGLERYVVGFGF